MIKNQWIKISLFTLLIQFTNSALAQGDGFYVGLEGGYSFTENIPNSSNNGIGRLEVGYQFNPYVGIEAGILGTFSSLYAIDGFLRGTLPFIDGSRIFVEVGGADFRNSNFKHIFSSFAYGGGFGFDVNDSWSFDLSYHGYSSDDRSLQAVTVGVSYHLN